MKYLKKGIMILMLAMIPFLSFSQIKPLDAMLTNYQYPFEVHFIALNTQNQHLKMAYMDVKPKEPNGKVIMLLHGKNFNGAYWEQTAKDLSAKGFRVIIPDQIGFGKSSKPQCYQFSFSQLADNTKKILDELKIDKAIVLGHSMEECWQPVLHYFTPRGFKSLSLKTRLAWKIIRPLLHTRLLIRHISRSLKIQLKPIKIIS